MAKDKDLIRQVQAALNTRGAKLKVDGVNGKNTRAAIESYEREAGLTPTGKASSDLLMALMPPTPRLRQEPDVLGTGRNMARDPEFPPNPAPRPPMVSETPADVSMPAMAATTGSVDRSGGPVTPDAQRRARVNQMVPGAFPEPSPTAASEPGTPEYSEAFMAARKTFMDAGGRFSDFPMPGEWRPGWKPPEERAKDVLRTGLANIAAKVEGSSDAPAETGPDGTYNDFFERRWTAIEGDKALDDLTRPMFDAAAAGNPVAAANGDKLGDTWRTVKMLGPQAAQLADKGATEKPIGLPGGREYPDVGTMAKDVMGAAGGILQELYGIKPAQGSQLPTDSDRPPTQDELLRYLTGQPVAPPAKQGPLDAAYSVIGEGAKAVAANTVDAVAQAIPGTYAAVKAALDGIDQVSIAAAGAAGEATGIQFLKDYAKGSLGIPEVNDAFGEPETPAGAMSRGVVQFLVGFAAGGRALQGLGWAAGGGKIAQGSRMLVQGAIADGVFFDGQAGKLGDLLVQFPALQNPVTEFLSTDPDDSEAEGRFKNALNGVVATPMIPAFVATVRAVRAGGRAVGALGAAERAGLDLTGRAAPRSLLGDASEGAPVTAPAAVDPATGKIATAAAEVEAKGFTPIGGTAGGPQVFVNFAAIKTPDDIQKVANDMVAAFESSTGEARRGVVSWDATRKAAGELDAFDTLMARRTGEAPSAAQVYAWKSLYLGALTKLQQVAREAQTAPLDQAPAALMQMREMQSLVLAIQKDFYGARAEAGRALNAFRIPADQALQAKQVEGLLNQYGGIDANLDLARKIAGINDTTALADFIEKSTFTKTKEAWQQWFYFAVLSSPKTHIRNFVGNNVMLGLNMAETGFAAQLSRLMGDDAVRAGEAAAQWFGIKAAFGDALTAAARTWRTGESMGGYGLNKVDAPRTNAISSDAWNLSQTSVFGRAVDALGAVTSVPGRALQTSDEFFKTVGASATGYQAAFKQAQREIAQGKLTPDGLVDRITELVSDFPNRLDDAAKADVAAQAAYLTFTTPPKPGGFTSTLLRLREVGNQPDASIGAQVAGMAARTIIPFVNTPSNILLATFERTPLAPITARYKEAMAAGGAAAYQANARMAFGTMTMATFVDLSMNGQVTDGGPKNRAEYATLYATGWRPYSVKIGDKYISYQGIEPLSTVLGWGAAIGEMLANTDQADPTANENIEAAIAATTFALFDLGMSKSYMQSTSDFIETINSGSEGAAGAFFRKWGGGQMVPNVARDVKNIVDPAQRYTTGVIEDAMSRMPGLSDDLPPRRDAFGFVKSYQSGFGNVYDAISPFYASQVKDMPVATSMLKDGWGLGMPQQAFTIDGQRVDISGQPVIYSRYLELRGQVKPSQLMDKVNLNYFAADRYTSGEAAQNWSDRLRDRYGDRTMVDALNGIVGESPPYDLVDLATRYHSFTDADERARFIRNIIGDYQDAAKAALFSEYPELPARAARQKEAGQELVP